ncbi:(Fe-S)-binding protein [Mobilicoccus pelagius]|nr:(Fe-S)-binding protein [Mobilicoccus pelagius]
MSALQITAIVLCLIVPTIGWCLLFWRVYRFTALYRSGAPDPNRTDRPGARTGTLLKEFLGHTRMKRLPVVAIAHWFTAIGFLVLFSTLVNAFFQLIWPDFRLPVIGHFPPFEWLVELLAWGCLIGIVVLAVIRQKNHPRNAAGEHGRRSRFFGSTWWHAYFVEVIILLVSICILSLRTQEAALLKFTEPGTNLALHFPLTAWLSPIWGGLDQHWLEESIYLVAAIKILVSFTWMIVVSLTPTMGVAWHRFLAFFNIWFKRHADGRTSLGELQPMRVNGEAVTAENLEDLMEAAESDDEDADEDSMKMGVGHVQDYTWKQLLDFSTCTECGRCQSQCPAWNTDKPLSPKLLMMTMRDHANEMAPWLQASTEDRAGLPEHVKKLATVPLVGETGYEADHPLGAYDALGPDAVIDSDVLWSCTTCGACVEQCPVDIEHVDAIVDMRRHQVLIESAFPAEFGGLFKNLESKQNPWGMAPKMRLDWAKGLDFEVPVVGADVEDLSSVDYLFWVGCAGAFEDRAKKTTRAVAELLHEADVSFAVLGDSEACTGDSARRAGNEILYQMLAAQNVEMLNEVGAKKIVVTCAHCYNTLRNEYPQNGGRYEVVHHTQLLNRLVRDKRLVPVARPAEHPGLSTAKNVASTAETVTYHDPCYLGRHNNVYAPPRELIGALPGVELREMPRHGMKSFCCGAGGARMWAEENLGTRINLNRTAEAVETGADRIAIGCPFCRVMLSDGLTSMQSEGSAREEVEVVDVAQMLLAAVRRDEEPEAAPDAEVDVDSAGRGGDAGADTPEQVEAEAQEESAEGGSGEFETSDATAQAAAEARRQEAPAQAAPAADTTTEAPATEAPAKPAGGKMSAADALAMMQAQGGAQAEETPAADAPAAQAPAAEAPAARAGTESVAPKAMPKGKMSAADALAMMGAASGGAAAEAPAEAPTAPATTEAPAAQAPATEAPAAPAAEDPKAAPATEAPKAAPAAPAAPAAKAPVEMPQGKMSAADALAMMQAQTAAARAEETPAAAPDSEATAAEAPAAKAPVAEAPAAEAHVAEAPAAESTPAAQTEETPAPAEASAAPAPQAAAPSAEKAPARPAAASAKKIEMPSGRMSASEALALLSGAAATAAAEAPGEPVIPAPAAKAPAAEAPAAQTPAALQTEEPASPTPTSEAPAPAAEDATAPADAAPSTEAAAAPATVTDTPSTDSPEEPVPARPETPTASPAPEVQAPTPAPEPTEEQAPVEAPREAPQEQAAPTAPAATEQAAPAAGPRPGSAAWQKLLDAADGKPIAASEALKILGG